MDSDGFTNRVTQKVTEKSEPSLSFETSKWGRRPELIQTEKYLLSEPTIRIPEGLKTDERTNLHLMLNTVNEVKVRPNTPENDPKLPVNVSNAGPEILYTNKRTDRKTVNRLDDKLQLSIGERFGDNIPKINYVENPKKMLTLQNNEKWPTVPS